MKSRDGFFIEVLTNIINDICLLNHEEGLSDDVYEKRIKKMSEDMAVAMYLMADTMNSYIEDGEFDLEHMNRIVNHIKEMGF